MASTQTASLIYPKTDFVLAGPGPGNQRNVPVFAVEVAALALSSQPNVYAAGTTVRLDFLTAVPTAADIVLIDAAVAAHVGGITTGAFQEVVEGSDVSRDESAIDDGFGDPLPDAIAGVLNSGLLVGGTYELKWGCEISCDLDGAPLGNRSQARLEMNPDPVASPDFDLFAVTHNHMDDWLTVERSRTFNRKDGDQVNLRIRYKRTGPSGNPAHIRKVRLSLRRID